MAIKSYWFAFMDNHCDELVVTCIFMYIKEFIKILVY